jgi:hypothetical protein
LATAELTGKDGRSLTVTATPAGHGPAGIEPMSGDVIGFVLTSATPNSSLIYIIGARANPFEIRSTPSSRSSAP